MRRLGAAAAVAAVLLAGGCSGSARHGSSSSTGVEGRISGPEGSGCLDALHKAVSSTLAASSFTLGQDAWREQPANSKVSGGGAAVITYQAPDRFHVVATSANGRHPPTVEQVTIGSRSRQGSAGTGWVAYTTRQPTDPLRWLKVPGAAAAAQWADGWCAFSAEVHEGSVTGRVGIDLRGHLATLAMTLTTGSGTIRMSYRVSRIGSSPPVRTPRT